VQPELAFALAGGSWIFLGVIIFGLYGVVIGIYTIAGSGINQHPYSKVGQNAAGARGPCSISGHDESDSTLQLHRRRPRRAKPAWVPRPEPASVQIEVSPSDVLPATNPAPEAKPG
jgi:hypothetical protein